MIHRVHTRKPWKTQRMAAAMDAAAVRHQAAFDPETWGLWHTHTCVDCHQPYQCSTAHGLPLSPTSKTRCERCLTAWLEQRA